MVLSEIYARVASHRRRWYARHPDACRRLERPVVSIGALAAGGRGKTPVTAWVAMRLCDAGERPAILSRGYARREPVDGVVVVRDAERIHATLATAGDEPLMLAERLPGVPVLVSDDRYLAGRLAERRLGATVHLLDDGFQHLPLARDVDLVLTRPDDLDARTLPGGRLRERPDTARLADAVVVEADGDAEAARVADRLGVETVFRLERSLGAPRPFGRETEGARVPAGARVIAVAGIAEPARFAAALAAAGFDVAETIALGDHHAYSTADVRRIAARAAALAVDWVLTTDKDRVRLAPQAPLGVPVAAVPLSVSIEPADRFRVWLLARVAEARAGR